MQYHIARNGQQAGTFSEETVREKLQRGDFSPGDLCWTEGMADWQPLSVQFAAPQAVQTFAEGEMNPYAPPQAAISATRESNLTLATLGQRLGAAALDGVVALVCALPMLIGLWNSGFFETPEFDAQPDVAKMEGAESYIAVSGLLMLAMFVYTLILLATRGQTIGKKLLAIRIVTFPDGANPGGVKTILLRVFVNGLIGAVPFLGSIYTLVDICFIFREDRRCIHDLIAGTQVVQGQPPGK